jgi:hypothetical protein
LKITLGIAGALLIAVTPYFWFSNADLLWIAIPLICVWSAWLMFEYLRWARALGKRPK